MITTELLNQQEALNGLTDEQKTAIVELSKNDEGIVIGDRIGKIYGDLDADILAASGMEKQGTEKTYVYAKRVIGELKSRADSIADLQNQVASLTTERDNLQKSLADGAADAETKKQLAQAKADLADITKRYTDLNTEYEGAKAKHNEEMFGLRVGMELESAANALKYKSSIPESVKSVVIRDVVAKLKASADYVDYNGTKVLGFKDENGATITDKSLNPLSASAMLQNEMDKMGILDKRREQTGAGSEAPKPEHADALDIAGAKTQQEAQEIIHKQLAAKGLINGTDAYQAEMDKAWKANNVNKLPIK